MAELNIRVNVDPGGAAAAATARVATETTRLKDAAKAAGEQAAKLGRDAQVAGQLMLRGGFGGEIAERLRHVAEGFRIAGDTAQTTGTRAQALSGSFGLIAGVAQHVIGSMVDMVRGMQEASARFSQHQETVGRLGAAYEVMRGQTAGTITATQALGVQQSLLVANLDASATTLGRVARAGREYAAIYGGDAASATATFIAAVQSGDATVLQHFGVTLDHVGTSTENLRGALSQLAADQAQNPPLPPSSAEAMAEFDAATVRSRDSVSRWVNELGTPLAHLRALREQAGETANTVQTMTVAIQANRREMLGYTGGAGAGTGGFGSGGRLDSGIGGNIPANYREHANAALGRIREREEQRIYEQGQAAIDRAIARGGRPENAGGGGGGGTSTADRWYQIGTELRAIGPLAATLGTDFNEETARRRGESLARYQARMVATHAAMQSAAAAADTARQASLADIERRALARPQPRIDTERLGRAGVNMGFQAEQMSLRDQVAGLSPEGQRLVGAQRREGGDVTAESIRAARDATTVGQQMRGVFVQTQTSAQLMAHTVSGAWQQMTSAVSDHYKAVVEGRESFGTAVAGMAHDAIVALGQRSIVSALEQTASGFANLALMNYPGAAQNFAAAAAFGGVAVLAGVVGAATTPAAPSAGGGSGGLAASSPRIGGSAANDNAGGNVTYVMNFQSAMITREDAQDTMRRAQNAATYRNVRSEDISRLQRARVA